MNKYLSILRGINVSGQKKIVMKDLKILYEALKYKNVQTYIQSGNVIFETNSSKNLAEKIEQKIADTYQFQVPVMIRTTEEMTALIKNNPFLKDKSIDQKSIYVTFLAELPKTEDIAKMNEINCEVEKIFISSKEIYVYCPAGYGNAKFNNNFIERKLKITATTRNWKTVNELFTLMKD